MALYWQSGLRFVGLLNEYGLLENTTFGNPAASLQDQNPVAGQWQRIIQKAPAKRDLA